MQIIVVSSRFSKAISLTLTVRQIALTALAVIVLVMALSGTLSYMTLRHAAEFNVPFLQSVVAGAQEDENKKTQDLVRDNLKAIASKVGQLQAQLLHLDSLGERLSAVVGIKPTDLSAGDTRSRASGSNVAKTTGSKVETGDRGGPLITTSQYRMSAEELGQEVDRLLARAELQTDYLSVVDTTLLDRRIAKNRLPTVLPVNALWNASAFGWRNDPFTQQKALHEGVDFSAEVGTPIVAAANGVVIAAEIHPEYGNLVEIDHANEYSSRYAHMSTMLVSPGQLVKRGQHIGNVGNTGRSTGPHLHFEVRYKGAAVNPARFLPKSGDASINFAKR